MAIIYEIIGVVGASTGIASLIWHILNNKPKLVIKRLYFKAEGFRDVKSMDGDNIGVSLLLGNKSNRPTTIEDIWITIDNHVFMDKFPKPLIMPAGHSEPIKLNIDFNEKDYKELQTRGDINFNVDIFHTFDSIKKGVYGNLFDSGYLNVI